jgi:hypothetical protein
LVSAIEAGGIVRLEWVNSRFALIATYTNNYKHEYTTICANNLNSMSKENQYPNHKDKGRWIPEWQLLLDKKTGRRSYPSKEPKEGSSVENKKLS